LVVSQTSCIPYS